MSHTLWSTDFQGALIAASIVVAQALKSFTKNSHHEKAVGH